MWKIYDEQYVDEKVLTELKKLIVFVYVFLIRSSNNSLISEYAKRESTWKLLNEQSFELDFESIGSLLVSKEEVFFRELENEIVENISENNLMKISKILGYGNRFWDGLSKFSLSDLFLNSFSTDIWEISNKIKRDKNLNSRDISIAMKILRIIEENKIDIESVKELSNQIEKELTDIKAVYDRLKLIKKSEWSKIFDLGEQTKIFDNLEILNLKSVYRSITKNELVKEINLLNALKSIRKLRRFGLLI